MKGWDEIISKVSFSSNVLWLQFQNVLLLEYNIQPFEFTLFVCLLCVCVCVCDRSIGKKRCQLYIVFKGKHYAILGE